MRIKVIDNATLTLYLLRPYNINITGISMDQDIKIRLNNIYHCKLKELATLESYSLEKTTEIIVMKYLDTLKIDDMIGKLDCPKSTLEA